MVRDSKITCASIYGNSQFPDIPILISCFAVEMPFGIKYESSDEHKHILGSTFG